MDPQSESSGIRVLQRRRNQIDAIADVLSLDERERGALHRAAALDADFKFDLPEDW